MYPLTEPVSRLRRTEEKYNLSRRRSFRKVDLARKRGAIRAKQTADTPNGASNAPNNAPYASNGAKNGQNSGALSTPNGALGGPNSAPNASNGAPNAPNSQHGAQGVGDSSVRSSELPLSADVLNSLTSLCFPGQCYSDSSLPLYYKGPFRKAFIEIQCIYFPDF